ncbi:MAG: Gx transporter family protein [Oscillospiraceae bacterium]|nr:Gx transporter family protein [Oscillospiraceae bacterium]
MKVKRIAELALLTALALIIFVVELQIPSLTPIPGIKLGLANIITVFAVYRYRAGEAALVLLARIILGSLFSGNMTAIMYSLAGGALCLLGMLLLKRVIPLKHMWLCSVFGAVLHNVGQTAVACAVTGTVQILWYLPALMLSGCVAGAFTGLCAQLVVSRLYKGNDK